MPKYAVARAMWKLVPESLKPNLLSNRHIRALRTKLAGSSHSYPMPLVRSRSTALDAYEAGWNTELDRVKRLIDRGEPQIPVIINSLINAEPWDPLWFKHLDVDGHLEDYMLTNGIQRTPAGCYPKKVDVINGQYELVPSRHDSRRTLIDFLCNTIKRHSDIASVVELGAGIGINLFLLFYALPEACRTRLTFFACEPTESGREAINSIARLDQSLELHISYFDYWKGDFSFLERKNKSVLFFTSHSIEQIPRLPDNFFDKLLTSSELCYGVHFEPVGWQTRDELALARLAGDKGLFQRMQRGIPLNLRDNNVTENAAWWSYMKDYNLNLISLLQRYAADGRISLEAELYDCGGANPFNPSSLISWKKVCTTK